MTESEYFQIDAMNWSRLKALRVSPKLFHHQRTAKCEETPALRIGRAAHCFILDPDQFERQFAHYPGYRRGREWDGFQEKHPGKCILNESEYYRALGIANAVANHPLAQELLAQGLKEAAFTWTDAETGEPCKGRIDHAGVRLVDLKTCAQIDPRRFMNQSATLGYHIQLAWYQDGLTANGIKTAPEPVIIAAESDEPFDVVCYTVPVDVIDAGRDEYRRLLKLFQMCRSAGSWPGIAADLQTLYLPAWATAGDEFFLTSGGEVIDVL